MGNGVVTCPNTSRGHFLCTDVSLLFVAAALISEIFPIPQTAIALRGLPIDQRSQLLIGPHWNFFYLRQGVLRTVVFVGVFVRTCVFVHVGAEYLETGWR